MLPLRSFLFLLLAALCPLVTWAHDPFENTVDLRLTAEALEITAVLSPPSATALLKNPDAGAVSKATFPGYRADLLAAAPRVCALLDGEGKLIAPSRTHVSLNTDGEAVFFFEFPASTRPASLRSDLIASLGAGYYCEVTDRTVSPARRLVLVRARPSCPLAIPSAANPP